MVLTIVVIWFVHFRGPSGDLRVGVDDSFHFGRAGGEIRFLLYFFTISISQSPITNKIKSASLKSGWGGDPDSAHAIGSQCPNPQSHSTLNEICLRRLFSVAAWPNMRLLAGLGAVDVDGYHITYKTIGWVRAPQKHPLELQGSI